MRGWTKVVAVCAAAALASSAWGQSVRGPPVSAEQRAAAEAAVARFTSPTLTTFSGDEEFLAYLEALRAAARARGLYWIGGPSAQGAGGEEPCPEDEPDCRLDSAAGMTITVTGSAIMPSNPSITNNQVAGIEEGGIVKQIGRFLLVLQDGRIFVADTDADGRGALALSDRINVYRDPSADIWYDEMLVLGDRILVSGFSYGAQATELSVFRLSETGRLSREGVFHFQSDDYYSSTNYATRLVGDDLVIYTPLDLLDVSVPFQWPSVRRWMSEEERSAAAPDRPLFEGRTVYRPQWDLLEPRLHAVSVCPLGPLDAGETLQCRTTAIVGPSNGSWLVTADEVFLWSVGWPPYDHREPTCEEGRPAAHADTIPSLLYRVPIRRGPLQVAAVRGVPFDQFSFHAARGRLRVFVDMHPARCATAWDGEANPALLDMPLSDFGNWPSEVAAPRYRPLPRAGSRWVANRFTDQYLVYGALSRFRSGFPQIDPQQEDKDSLRWLRRATQIHPAYVVELAAPGRVRPLAIGHSVIRAERVADDIVLTGYSDRSGLKLSYIDLSRTPRIGSTLHLEGRFESEGRSHAFNSLVDGEGGGLMGLPTTPYGRDSRREWWRSRASDLSFVSLRPGGSLASLGELAGTFVYDMRGNDTGVPGYECEVSCVDWYGNSRPIFTGGRIFALSGIELIEGRVRGGRISEVGRINLVTPEAPGERAP